MQDVSTDVLVSAGPEKQKYAKESQSRGQQMRPLDHLKNNSMGLDHQQTDRGLPQGPTVTKAQNQPSGVGNAPPPEPSRPQNRSSRGIGREHQKVGRVGKGLPQGSAKTNALNLIKKDTRASKKRPLQVSNASEMKESLFSNR